MDTEKVCAAIDVLLEADYELINLDPELVDQLACLLGNVLHEQDLLAECRSVYGEELGEDDE